MLFIVTEYKEFMCAQLHVIPTYISIVVLSVLLPIAFVFIDREVLQNYNLASSTNSPSSVSKQRIRVVEMTIQSSIANVNCVRNHLESIR